MAERFARQRLKALAKIEGLTRDGLPTVLFLCVHNAGRSQMALGLFNHLAGGRAVAWSGGSEPGKEVNPAAVAGHGRGRHRHRAGVPQALDRRDRPRRRRGHHHGLRRRLPALPRQALRGLGPRRPRRAKTSTRCARSATRSNNGCGLCWPASTCLSPDAVSPASEIQPRRSWRNRSVSTGERRMGRARPRGTQSRRTAATATSPPADHDNSRRWVPIRTASSQKEDLRRVDLNVTCNRSGGIPCLVSNSSSQQRLLLTARDNRSPRPSTAGVTSGVALERSLADGLVDRG